MQSGAGVVVVVGAAVVVVVGAAVVVVVGHGVVVGQGLAVVVVVVGAGAVEEKDRLRCLRFLDINTRLR